MVGTDIMSNTYVTDITHYLDKNGELVTDMPSEAKQLASFLVLVIDSTTSGGSVYFDDSGIRCRGKRCTETVLSRLTELGDEIEWHCPICGQNGIIRNWKNTKWNQRKL